LDKPELAYGSAPAGRLWNKLSNTRRKLTDRLNALVTGKNVIDPPLLKISRRFFLPLTLV